jgi:hypothetical protein
MEHLLLETVADLRPAGLGSRIERPKAANPAFTVSAKENKKDGLLRASSGLAWDLTPASATSQPWRQVRL